MATERLQIASDLSLPINAVTQKFAFLGRTGNGKTYAVLKLIELLLDVGAQVVVFDPAGVYHGLRLKKDGKTPGYPIPVFGGLRGDLGLDSSAGTIVADLIADRKMSAILDVSQMTDSDLNRFSTDFATQMFRRQKSEPSPIQIVLEECEEFVPQNFMKGEEMKLHAFRRFAKQGRNFGIGLTLVSQRPQDVNKKVLNQTECMFVFQMNGPQERKAIEDWVYDKGIDIDVGAVLPKLEVGHPMVWSPQWLKVSKVVSILGRSTFDASKTPEFGKVIRGGSLPPINLDEIRQSLESVIERAAADDPRVLREKIVQLTHELKVARSIPAVPLRVEVPINRLCEDDLRVLQRVAQMIQSSGNFLNSFLESQDNQAPPPVLPNRVVEEDESRLLLIPSSDTSESALPKAVRSILTVLAQYRSGRSKGQLAVLAGYAVNGGGFLNALSFCRKRDYVGQRGDQFFVKPSGLSLLGHYDPLPTGRALIEYWMSRLALAERSMLKALVDVYPNKLSRNNLAIAAGHNARGRPYESSGGGFTNAISALRVRELLVGNDRTQYKASDHLFL